MSTGNPVGRPKGSTKKHRSRLTEYTEGIIVAYIRQGSYDYQAALAAGISSSAFEEWKRRGAAGEEPFATFYLHIQEARAQARVVAEIEVKKTNPLAWLRYGPGRERPGEPGWTESVQVTGAGAGPLDVRSQAQVVVYKIPDNGRDPVEQIVEGVAKLMLPEKGEEDKDES